MSQFLDPNENFEGFNLYDICQFSNPAYKLRRQRCYLKSALSHVATEAGEYLRQRPFHYLPNRIDSRFTRSLFIGPQPMEDAPWTRKNFRYRKFPSLTDMLVAAEAVGERHDLKLAYLWLGPGCPYIEVELGWARRHLAHFVFRDQAVLLPDLKAGMVLTSELGTCHNAGRMANPPHEKFVLVDWGF